LIDGDSNRRFMELDYPTRESVKSIDQPLHVACQEGCIDTVLDLIRQGVDVNQRGNRNRSALHYASERSFIEIAEVLIQRGADVNATDSDESTPLHLAAAPRVGEGGLGKHISKTIKTVELLIGLGANPKARNRNQLTAMGCAVLNELPSCWEVVACLIDRAQLDVDDPISSSLHEFDTALNHAILQRNLSCSCWLIQQGACVEKIPFESKVIAWSNCDFIDYMMERHYALIPPDLHGKTPLHYASYSGNLEAVKSVSRSVRSCATMQDREGNTAVHVAAAAAKSLKVVQWLVQCTQTDPNIQNSRRWTPLHVAVQNPHNNDICRWLMEYGVDIFAKNNSGQTPADIENGYLQSEDEKSEFKVYFKHVQKAFRAIYKSRIDRLVDALGKARFEGHCAASVRDKRGNTMLLAAVSAKNASQEIVQLLVQQEGVNINEMNHDGFSAIHVVAQAGRLDLLQCLQGGNLTAPDKKSIMTPLHYACKEGHVFVVDWIIQQVGIGEMIKSAIAPLHVAAEACQWGVLSHFIVQYGNP